MQMIYGLYRRFLVDLAYLKEPVVIKKETSTKKLHHFQSDQRRRGGLWPIWPLFYRYFKFRYIMHMRGLKSRQDRSWIAA